MFIAQRRTLTLTAGRGPPELFPQDTVTVAPPLPDDLPRMLPLSPRFSAKDLASMTVLLTSRTTHLCLRPHGLPSRQLATWKCPAEGTQGPAAGGRAPLLPEQAFLSCGSRVLRITGQRTFFTKKNSIWIPTFPASYGPVSAPLCSELPKTVSIHHLNLSPPPSHSVLKPRQTFSPPLL